MMRSGTTELSGELAANVPGGTRLTDLGEIFNPGPERNRPGTASREEQLMDPVGYLWRHLPSNTSAVWKHMNGHLPDAQLLSLLRDPAVCPIVIERNNITAQFCSLIYAGLNNDWGGHVSKTGRTHPPCEPSTVGVSRSAIQGLGHNPTAHGNFAQFIARHQEWYERITRTLQRERIPYLYITFDELTRRRAYTFANIYQLCGLKGNVVPLGVRTGPGK